MIDLAFALTVAGLAVIQEVRSRSLPDWLVLGVAVVGPAIHTLAAAMNGARSWHLIGAAIGSALGAIACAALPLLLLKKRKLRRGDVVLFVALGAVLGPILGVGAQLFALGAAFLAGAIITWRARNATARWLPLAPAVLGGVFLATVTSAT